MDSSNYQPIDSKDILSPSTTLDIDPQVVQHDDEVIPSRAAHWLLALGVLGLALASLMVYEYYHPEGSSICDFSSTISCTQLVQKGWASILGVPIAAFGVEWFVVLLVAELLAIITASWRYILVVLLWAVLGALFIVYLVAVEILMGVLCPICTMIHLILVAVLLLAVQQFRRQNGDPAMKTLPNLVWRQLPHLFQREALFLTMVVVLTLTQLVAFNASKAVPDEDQNWTLEMKLALAQCLHNKHIKMFGSSHCGHCIHQKALFAEAVQYVDFFDCDDIEVKPKCNAAGLFGYPTWIIYDDSAVELGRHVGMMSLTGLSQWSHCDTPEQPALLERNQEE